MEEAEEKGNEEISKSNSDFVRKIKKNPWIISTIALGLIVVVFLVVNFTGMTGKVISEDKAVENTIGLIKQAYGVSLEYVSAQEEDGLYAINCLLDGNPLVIKTTKDFSFILLPGDKWVRVSDLQEKIDLTQQTQQQAQQNVPKSDKPVADAFIFSYCPYGLQFEKALFSVYDLLKNKVDFNIVAIGAMHGEFEKTETLRQISIEKLYNKDKLFAYLKEFDNNADIGECNGDDTCLNKYLPAIYSKLGIDKTKVENYIKTNAEAIYNEQGKEASSLGISGSPTFVINGVQVQVGRNAEAIKGAICDAFNTVPDECSQTLSTTGASAGFGGTVSAPQDTSHPSTATGGSCA